VLYQLIARLDEDKDTYARPITVVDRKTHYAMEANKAFLDFRKDTVAGIRIFWMPGAWIPARCGVQDWTGL